MSIKQCVKQVKANENQCKRLADRIDAITSALKSLNNNNLERLELRTALLNFLTYIEQCLEFIKKFNDESTWYIKVFNNQNFKNKFEELNLQLSQTATDLNLSINLKEIFDSKMDESDQRIDLYTIQSKLDEIASMMVQRSEEQFGRYKDIEQHICRRFNSFKHHLEQNINVAAHDSFKVRDEHAFVQIPYYDLMLEKMVGQGGFANVYLGKWLPQDHQVAIKIIRTQHLGDRVKEDFVSEVSTMYRIRYDHILNIFGACMEPENYALIVEYMSLGSLYDVLRQKQVHLTWSDRWSIALQMTKGINHLHTHSKPIIHRDIKSLNVLMGRGDKDFLVKIADFGLAKIRYEISRQSSHNSSVGTLPWKAPELLKMAKHTEASDVYALGIVLWELATECEPYEDSDESTISAFVLRGDRLNIPATIPNLFAELITRSWAHEPSKRLSCQQLLVSMKIGYTALNIVENMKDTAGGVAEIDSVAKQCLSPTNSSKIQSNETSNIRTLLPDIPRNAKWMKDGITIVGKNKSDAILKQLDSPHGLYVDENQVIYIVDHGNDRIVEWKSTSKSIQVVAGGNGQGSRNDQLNKPTDVVVDKKTNSLIICDRSNRRLVQWPCRHGAKRGEIILENICCWGLTTDNENFLYISDWKKHEVKRYRMGETEGTVVAGGNGQGDRLDQLSFPTYLSVDRDQSVYVSDFYNNRVMKWMKDATEGIIVAGHRNKGNDLTQLNGPQGVFVDLIGTVYVADRRNHQVMRWFKGTTQGDIIVGGNKAGQNANQLNMPQGLSFDRYGNMYVIDWGNNRLQKYSIQELK
ncbi:unnamed protein product [Adineta steineri]|uniref:Protein kinase domain-containing protein n=1 Tax=Adineta steineri TaxID=433720 RepID=A0A818UK32_9BILA|nr:unnamed protein product [Adineta steineri]